MLTDQEARDLLARAATTIEVGPTGAPLLERRRGRVPLLAAAAVLAVLAAAGVFVAVGDDVVIEPTAPTTSPSSATATPPADPYSEQHLLPGGTRVIELAEPVTTEGTGSHAVALGERPKGATAVKTAFACLTPGRFRWPDGAMTVCDESDPVGQGNVGHHLLDLGRGQTTLEIRAGEGQSWRLVTTYVRTEQTQWGVNARGETYGVPKEDGSTPDLVAVMATNGVQGYAYAVELEGPVPSSLEEAIEQQEAAGDEPRVLPVYESDGETVIGEFEISPGRESTRPHQGPSADPILERSEFPSGLVARLSSGDVQLPADTSCWTDDEHCRRALMGVSGDQGPDLGTHEAIDFWFAKPGWEFSATFRRAGEACPRATTIDALRTDDQWFRLPPADEPGTYEVDLYGQGPEGSSSTRFLWTTTAEGPLDPPRGQLGVFPRSRGEGTYGLEVMFDDLPFQPTATELSEFVTVRLVDSRGREMTHGVRLVDESLDCQAKGWFYYQAEWDEAESGPLGKPPFDVEVALTIRGVAYVGRGTWQRSRAAYTDLTFTPPLPAAAN